MCPRISFKIACTENVDLSIAQKVGLDLEKLINLAGLAQLVYPPHLGLDFPISGGFALFGPHIWACSAAPW